VPCFVRRQFNNMVGNVFDVVAPDGKDYKFNVRKFDRKTLIFGSAYLEFLLDYDMKVGDSISLKFDHSPQFFSIFPECPMGNQKQRVQGN
jgi:hypothetical protein